MAELPIRLNLGLVAPYQNVTARGFGMPAREVLPWLVPDRINVRLVRQANSADLGDAANNAGHDAK
jgi:hypothetical protein